ncbi:hypothetical protein PGTUg99_010792 [Puccinia graminis f. sp. tritici]|uniref:Uncharacterized protein n=1 Tax=Puccinia graminis f. sp. tritici TaxID=56615 RepID=A0A5B0QKZ7_PUCGR|nr:hypothetical protein PGTUg99_010792 [Puccinia graminis f. sp. tritici]
MKLRRPGTAGAVAEALPGEMGDQSRQMQFTVGHLPPEKTVCWSLEVQAEVSLAMLDSHDSFGSTALTDQHHPISDDRSLHAQSNSSSRCHSSHRCFAAPRHPRHSASLQKVELDSALVCFETKLKHFERKGPVRLVSTINVGMDSGSSRPPVATQLPQQFDCSVCPSPSADPCICEVLPFRTCRKSQAAGGASGSVALARRFPAWPNLETKTTPKRIMKVTIVT